MEEDIYQITCLEFGEDCLLVSGEYNSYLFGLEGEGIQAEFPYGNMGYHTDHYLTADGLLFCTMRTNKPYELSAVYDVKTGDMIFGPATYFQYDEENGLLVYQPGNSISDLCTSVRVAARNEEGKFKDIYTLTPERLNLILQTGWQCVDGGYFLLNGENICEVYELKTGSRVLTLRGSEYLLCCNTVYDRRLNRTDSLLRYTIMDLEQLMEKSKQFLTSEYGIRRLTEKEKVKYFINKWE